MTARQLEQRMRADILDLGVDNKLLWTYVVLTVSGYDVIREEWRVSAGVRGTPHFTAAGSTPDKAYEKFVTEVLPMIRLQIGVAPSLEYDPIAMGGTIQLAEAPP